MPRNPFALAFWMATCALACIADSGEMRIERKVAEACRETELRQSLLSDICSLADYRMLVKSVGGTNMWTSALQRALDEHEIVRIPASDETTFSTERCRKISYTYPSSTTSTATAARQVAGRSERSKANEDADRGFMMGDAPLFVCEN